MRMACRPRQHGAGYAEIIGLPGHAFVDDFVLAHLGLKSRELIIGFAAPVERASWRVIGGDLVILLP
jgi:hypothetical protein